MYGGFQGSLELDPRDATRVSRTAVVFFFQSDIHVCLNLQQKRIVQLENRLKRIVQFSMKFFQSENTLPSTLQTIAPLTIALLLCRG